MSPPSSRFPRSRICLAVARWMVLAPVAVLAVSTTASAAETAPGAASSPAADVVDGRARWRAPLRAGTHADGRADWAMRPRPAAAIPADAGEPDHVPPPTVPSPDGGSEAIWVDVVVDGELKRAPRLRPAPAPSTGKRLAAPTTSRASSIPTPAPLPMPAPAPRPTTAPATPTPSPAPAPLSDGVTAVLPRDERGHRRSIETPAVAGAMPTPVRTPVPTPAPSAADGASDALLERVRALGISSDADGRPCLTRDDVHAMLRVRETRAPDVFADDVLARLLDALMDDVNRESLDATVSRDWSVLRFGCESGTVRAPRDTLAGAPDIVLDRDTVESDRSTVDIVLDGRTDRDDAPIADTARVDPDVSDEPSLPAPASGRRAASMPPGPSASRSPATSSSADADASDGVGVEPSLGELAVPDGADLLPVPLPGGMLPGGALPGAAGPLSGPPGALAAEEGITAKHPSDADEPSLGGASDAGNDGRNEIASGLFVIDDDDVPAGFEMLAAPQSVWADIRFNGRKVGSTLLTTTADEILFDAPAEVVAMLPDIEDPERLMRLLTAPLAPNSDRVCFRPGDPVGCGVVTPDPVAVVYDENLLTLDLFVAGALQSVQARQVARYLPAPERRPTSILSLYSATSKTPGTDATFDLSGRLLASYGDGHVSAAADYGSSVERARLNELKLTHFSNGHELTAGTYGWGPGGALSDVPLVGVGFSTSFRTRIDLEQAFGTELVVYLPRRAIVQLVVDGRVQSGDSHEAGNRALDTRALPDGTYPVEIRIIESDGSTRSEFRTFTRSASIPPRGETVFGVTAGVARTGDELLPDSVEPLVAGVGLSRRLGERAAVTIGAAQLGRDGVGQSELVYLGERLSLQAAFTLGRERTFGTTATGSFDVVGTRFGLSYRSFHSDAVRLGDPARELFYPENGERWDATIDRSFGPLALGFSASRGTERIDGGEPEDTRRLALRARRTMFRSRDMRGTLSASVRDVDGERFGSVRFDVSFGREAWSSGLALDARSTREGHADLAQSARADYTGRGQSFDWEAGLRARRGASDSAGVRASVEHPLFRASAAHDVNAVSSDEETTSSVATLATQVGLDRHGAAIGGAAGTRSGVIVQVDGAPEGAAFDIVVNGSRAAVGQIGTSRFIGLQPFESYAVKLIPHGVLSNGLGADVHEFTLFPGNVQRIDALAESRVLLIASLVDERGEALGNAVIELGDDLSITDTGGLLQAEIPPGRRFEVKPLDGDTCTITTPEAEPGAEVLVADEPLVCRDGGLDGPMAEGAEEAEGSVTSERLPEPATDTPVSASGTRRAPSGRRKGNGSKRGAKGGKGGKGGKGRQGGTASGRGRRGR